MWQCKIELAQTVWNLICKLSSTIHFISPPVFAYTTKECVRGKSSYIYKKVRALISSSLIAYCFSVLCHNRIHKKISLAATQHQWCGQLSSVHVHLFSAISKKVVNSAGVSKVAFYYAWHFQNGFYTAMESISCFKSFTFTFSLLLLISQLVYLIWYK